MQAGDGRGRPSRLAQRAVDLVDPVADPDRARHASTPC